MMSSSTSVFIFLITFLSHYSAFATATASSDNSTLNAILSAVTPTPSGWSSTTHFCYWRGIECDGQNSVIVLDISSQSLSGPLPSFANLSRLRKLYLHNNSFTSIPTGAFSGLISLQILSLSNNTNLSPWPFPSELLSSPKMVALHARNANIIGSIPDIFRSFPSLRSLTLSYNNLTGSLPGSFNGSSIQELKLDNQNPGLTGSVDILSGMNHLSVVWIHGNKFTGAVPASLVSMPNLSDVRIDESNNDFMGSDSFRRSNVGVGSFNCVGCKVNIRADDDYWAVIPGLPPPPPAKSSSSNKTIIVVAVVGTIVVLVAIVFIAYKCFKKNRMAREEACNRRCFEREQERLQRIRVRENRQPPQPPQELTPRTVDDEEEEAKISRNKGRSTTPSLREKKGAGTSSLDDKEVGEGSRTPIKKGNQQQSLSLSRDDKGALENKNAQKRLKKTTEPVEQNEVPRNSNEKKPEQDRKGKQAVNRPKEEEELKPTPNQDDEFNCKTGKLHVEDGKTTKKKTPKQTTSRDDKEAGTSMNEDRPNTPLLQGKEGDQASKKNEENLGPPDVKKAGTSKNKDQPKNKQQPKPIPQVGEEAGTPNQDDEEAVRCKEEKKNVEDGKTTTKKTPKKKKAGTSRNEDRPKTPPPEKEGAQASEKNEKKGTEENQLPQDVVVQGNLQEIIRLVPLPPAAPPREGVLGRIRGGEQSQPPPAAPPRDGGPGRQEEQQSHSLFSIHIFNNIIHK